MMNAVRCYGGRRQHEEPRLFWDMDCPSFFSHPLFRILFYFSSLNYSRLPRGECLFRAVA